MINLDSLLAEKTLKEFAQKLLWTLAKELECVQGAFYIVSKNKDDVNVIRFVEGYAFHIGETQVLEYEFGEGIAGQVAKDGQSIYLSNIPDGYLTVLSGLGKSSPTYLLAFPFSHDNKVIAVIEVASFKELSPEHQTYLSGINDSVSKKIIELNK